MTMHSDFGLHAGHQAGVPPQVAAWVHSLRSCPQLPALPVIFPYQADLPLRVGAMQAQCWDECVTVSNPVRAGVIAVVEF